MLRVLETHKIDVLIPIGGDDTLSYGLRLHEEGVPVIAIPKTMDNDVHGTDYCIGFSTSVTRGVQFIHSLRTAAGSHERIAVVELFGRYSGETSLVTAYLSGVDRAIISEVPFEIDKLAAFLQEDQAANPSNYAMVTISEGARLVEGDIHLTGEEDAYGHRKLGGIGATTGELLKERTGEGILYQQIGYLMRSGAPDSLDLMVATNYAVMASDLAMEGAHGRMVALRGGTYTDVPIRRHPRGRETGRRGRVVRRRRLPAQGPPRPGQADVPLLRNQEARRTASSMWVRISIGSAPKPAKTRFTGSAGGKASNASRTCSVPICRPPCLIVSRSEPTRTDFAP